MRVFVVMAASEVAAWALRCTPAGASGSRTTTWHARCARSQSPMCALAPEPHSRLGRFVTPTEHLKSIHAVQHLEASVTFTPSWGEVCETIEAAQTRRVPLSLSRALMPES